MHAGGSDPRGSTMHCQRCGTDVSRIWNEISGGPTFNYFYSFYLKLAPNVVCIINA